MDISSGYRLLVEHGPNVAGGCHLLVQEGWTSWSGGHVGRGGIGYIRLLSHVACDMCVTCFEGGNHICHV